MVVMNTSSQSCSCHRNNPLPTEKFGEIYITWRFEDVGICGGAALLWTDFGLLPQGAFKHDITMLITQAEEFSIGRMSDISLH